MVTKKAAKKASSKAVTKAITLKLKKDFTLEDVRAAITPAIFKRLSTAQTLSISGGFLANKIPPKPPFPSGTP
jgi:hypothetical protein